VHVCGLWRLCWQDNNYEEKESSEVPLYNERLTGRFSYNIVAGLPTQLVCNPSCHHLRRPKFPLCHEGQQGPRHTCCEGNEWHSSAVLTKMSYCYWQFATMRVVSHYQSDMIVYLKVNLFPRFWQSTFLQVQLKSTNRQADRQSGRQVDRQTDTCKQRNGRTDRQTDRQTDRYTDNYRLLKTQHWVQSFFSANIFHSSMLLKC